MQDKYGLSGEIAPADLFREAVRGLPKNAEGHLKRRIAITDCAKKIGMDPLEALKMAKMLRLIKS